MSRRDQAESRPALFELRSWRRDALFWKPREHMPVSSSDQVRRRRTGRYQKQVHTFDRTKYLEVALIHGISKRKQIRSGVTRINLDSWYTSRIQGLDGVFVSQNIDHSRQSRFRLLSPREITVHRNQPSTIAMVLNLRAELTPVTDKYLVEHLRNPSNNSLRISGPGS
ncbi:hypothetical protein TWF132_006309 [Orbilia oligospora]|nr:hypothetical protein TWF132_006309 [Orbilia oligospora]